MPYRKDFEELTFRGEFNVEPDGWEPLTIEYGYEDIGNAPFFFWRVAGTEHTFKSTVNSLNYESGGDYRGHIEKFLVRFRQEMLEWIVQGIQAEWVHEYVREYNNLVKL